MIHIYHATMVKRWHTNPHMSDTGDPVGYHSGRMAILALKLWPCAWGLVGACLTHDLGEYSSGDIPWNAASTIKMEADEVADEWSIKNRLANHIDIGPHLRMMLKFLDRLDSYLWARHHAPHILQEAAWQNQRDWLKSEADKLGVDLCLFNM